MKYMRRILFSAFLISYLCLTLAPITHAELLPQNNEALVIEAGKVKGTLDKIVEIPIRITKNPGVACIGFCVRYNQDALEFIGYENPGLIFGKGKLDGNCDKNPIIFSAYSSSQDITETGVLLVLKFRVRYECPAGDYIIMLETGSLGGFVNLQEEILPVSYTNGEISVPSRQCLISANLEADGSIHYSLPSSCQSARLIAGRYINGKLTALTTVNCSDLTEGKEGTLHFSNGAGTEYKLFLMDITNIFPLCPARALKAGG